MQTEPRHILFVLGMHRSGTSALCAALQACGVSFGDQLLDPMDGVNDEGFWEDAEVVAINESLLRAVGSEWYLCDPGILAQDWSASPFDTQRAQARAIIDRGFGGSKVEAVKDPRFCLTLPFWLELCGELGIAVSTSVINRAPIEVARSLEARDGFPLGYGLRLYQTYRLGIARHAPDTTVYLTYSQLLSNPAGCMSRLAVVQRLSLSESDLSSVIRGDLRHHVDAGLAGLLFDADTGAVDFAELHAAIEQFSPAEAILGELAGSLVRRGVELSEIGDAHSTALATLDERDEDIEQLSREHQYALSIIDERDQRLAELDGIGEHLALALETIEERDAQISDFDRRLSKLGEEHSYALDLIRRRSVAG